jgi:hypothetical protein
VSRGSFDGSGMRRTFHSAKDSYSLSGAVISHFNSDISASKTVYDALEYISLAPRRVESAAELLGLAF